MAREPVDLLVIGAGSTGAGIARDAAMRGIRTALIDKGDFGSGTSSRSSRLIHGGLRYLELYDWRLVFEASRERRVLLRIAPHLVWPRSFLFPVYHGGRISRWKLAAGLWLYDALALFRNVKPHRMLGKRALLRSEPGLRERGLTGGARYFDAQCDDARLALANARSARAYGALVANYTGLDHFELADGQVRGGRVTDVIGGGSFNIRARVVVNATGPWSDAIRALAGEPPVLRRTKGTHIVVPRERLGNQEALTLTSPIDGRVMFVVPWGDLSYIGTTDTDWDRDPENVAADANDVVYLLRSANAYFPHARLQPEDVLSAWAGLRPLLRPADPRLPSAVSREHRIEISRTGLISVLGGKLTTYRSMAEETVNIVLDRLNRADGRPRRVPCRTHREPLPGGEVADLEVVVQDAERDGISHELAERLARSYGSEAPAILRLARSDAHLAAPIVPGYPAIRAELVHAIRREMAITLADLLVRRTHLFYEVTGHAAAEAATVVDLAAAELGWDGIRKASELAAYLDEVRRGASFRTELREKLGKTPTVI
ncbi:MAG: glycerol-3-phosphate dehydrogenase [Gemmatimonadetes bacterium]|nr:glycerol-3-phosphate dehydrogenase [Gemmatimonadota bacterium]